MGEDCEGWDDELMSKINTFFASKLEKLIKSVRLSGLSLAEYYAMVTFIQRLISVVSKEMDINGTILRACLDDNHKRSLPFR